GPGGKIDADRRAVQARKLGRPERGRVDRRSEQGVAGDVQTVARQPDRVEVARSQLRSDAAVGRHRPLPVLPDEGHDDAVPPSRRADELDSTRLELGGDEPTGRIIALLRDAPAFGPE